MITPPKINCATCIRRPLCTKLCDAAERYVSQDTVSGGREMLLSDIYFTRQWEELSKRNYDHRLKLTARDISIIAMINAGVPREIICKNTSLTRKQLREIIHRIRRTIRRFNE